MSSYKSTSPARYYTFRLTEPMHFIIDLKSETEDTYLVLRSSTSFTRDVLQKNDNNQEEAAGHTNARLSRLLPARTGDDLYMLELLVAGSLSSSASEYTLEIKPSAPIPHLGIPEGPHRHVLGREAAPHLDTFASDVDAHAESDSCLR